MFYYFFNISFQVILVWVKPIDLLDPSVNCVYTNHSLQKRCFKKKEKKKRMNISQDFHYFLSPFVAAKLDNAIKAQKETYINTKQMSPV